MASLEMNKIAAGILCAGLLAMGAGKIASFLVHPQHLEKSAMTVDTSALDAASAPATSGPEPIEPVLGLLATADVAKGERLAKACIACHSFDKGGANKVGPALYGTVGAKKGAHDGYSYSKAMTEFAGAPDWSYVDLNAFLHKPREFLPGTKMTYAGMKKPQDRADVIAYLRSLADSPAPLPTEEQVKAEAAAYEKAKSGG
jgi:cytochrome c